MGDDAEFFWRMRPFELLDKAVVATSCHIHIYKRINAASTQIKIAGVDANVMEAVRAVAITSALISLMACLDYHFTNYPDRASIGGLLHRLRQSEYRKCFLPRHVSDGAYDEAVDRLKNAFERCRASNDFIIANELRNNEVAHILDKNDTPTVPYDSLDRIFEDVREMCDLAFSTAQVRPTHMLYEARHVATADRLVTTYIRGMHNSLIA